jgi:hypothetical protein
VDSYLPQQWSSGHRVIIAERAEPQRTVTFTPLNEKNELYNLRFEALSGEKLCVSS